MSTMDKLARGESPAVQKAVESVAHAISQKATPDLPAGDLEMLAKALAVMQFGQQGVTHYYYEGTYDQTYSTDQHETHHEGERKGSRAGFTRSDVSGGSFGGSFGRRATR